MVDAPHVWRFGYGSNIGLETLKKKKNLNPSQFHTGTIKGWDLAWMPGVPMVDPAFGGVRQEPEAQLHGSAFLITEEEAQGLDRQEGGYNVVPSRFVAYSGEVVEDVGLYVNKTPITADAESQPTPSLRYLRLMQGGAKEGGLAQEWIDRLMAQKHYVTPPEMRKQTEQWIVEFDEDPTRKSVMWTAEELAGYDGSAKERLAHTSIMGYVVKIHPERWTFPAWKGNDVTRRMLLQFNGMSMDVNDRRHGQEGFRPLPRMSGCSDEEKEFLMQNFDSLLHMKCTIVGRLQDFLEDQGGELDAQGASPSA